VNGMIEIAGPEAVRMTDLVADFLKSTGDTREVIPDVHARYSDVEINDRSLTPDDTARLGRTYYKDWLSRNVARAA
jgi:uncharacterized protein YbjT (DUF2867 family)